MQDIPLKPNNNLVEIAVRPVLNIAKDVSGAPVIKSLFDLKPSTEFQSNGFKDLLSHLTEKQFEELANSQSVSASQMSTASGPVTIVPMKPADNMETILTISCGFGYDKKDLGLGKLEIIKSKNQAKPYALLIFRNNIGKILFQGNLVNASKWRKATEREIADSKDMKEYTIVCVSTENEQIQSKTCRVAITKQQKKQIFEAEADVLSHLSPANN